MSPWLLLEPSSYRYSRGIQYPLYTEYGVVSQPEMCGVYGRGWLSLGSSCTTSVHNDSLESVTLYDWMGYSWTCCNPVVLLYMNKL